MLVSQIKTLALDLDGVVTDGRVSFTATGEERKTIAYRDLDALTNARKSGLTVVAVTGAWPLGETRGVQFLQSDQRMQSLNVRGQESKSVHLLPGQYRAVLWQGSTIIHEEDVEVAGVTQAIRLRVLLQGRIEAGRHVGRGK